MVIKMPRLKEIRSTGNAFSIFVKKGLQGNRSVSECAKIYIPNSDISLFLESNRVSFL